MKEPRVRASLICEMPLEDRPRQRLLVRGSASLGDAELLSILIGSGYPGHCSLALAHDLLREAGSLGRLALVNSESLRRRVNGSAKAASIVAAIELGKRLKIT